MSLDYHRMRETTSRTTSRLAVSEMELIRSIQRCGVDYLAGKSFPAAGPSDLFFVTHALGQVIFIVDIE